MSRTKIVVLSSCVFVLCVALIGIKVSFTQVDGPQTYDRAKSKVIDPVRRQGATSGKDSVIGHLEFRDRRVTIISGPKGTVYTIQTAGGKTLAAKISEKALQTKYPALFNHIKYGLAGNDASIRQLPKHPEPASAR